MIFYALPATDVIYKKLGKKKPAYAGFNIHFSVLFKH